MGEVNQDPPHDDYCLTRRLQLMWRNGLMTATTACWRWFILMRRKSPSYNPRWSAWKGFMATSHAATITSKMAMTSSSSAHTWSIATVQRRFYTYDPQRRRLQNLTVNSGGNTIMDNAYTYDAVSNVLSVVNGAQSHRVARLADRWRIIYIRCPHRLVSATGTYTGADNKTASYTLAMVTTICTVSHRSVRFSRRTMCSSMAHWMLVSDLSYTYGTETGKKFQLANVKDVNYRTEETPSESENVNNNHAYEYDANGNLVYVNTSRTKRTALLTRRPQSASSNGMRRTVSCFWWQRFRDSTIGMT